MQTTNRYHLLIALAVTCCGLLLVLLLGRHWLPANNTPLSVSPDCDISQQACTARDSQQAIALEILTRPVTSMVPLDIMVNLENIPAQNVTLNLQGVDMYMGIHQVALSPTTNPAQWQGELTLAICTTGEMRWQATVIAHHADKQTLANFEFSAR
ncbi:hypothetical protein ACFVYJ_05345 [Pontibacter sp. JAM-7]|uniref:hypothetical protein n=1 Tax=Pontibacter sp. JAM-7 TaxID=3366581 RepID=UPI003AF482DB